MRDTKPITVGVRVTTAMAAQLRQIAEADDRTPSAVARRIIADALARKAAETQNR